MFKPVNFRLVPIECFQFLEQQTIGNLPPNRSIVRLGVGLHDTEATCSSPVISDQV